MQKKHNTSKIVNKKDEYKLKAIRAIKKGETQNNITKILGVSRQTISTWFKQYKKNGIKSLKTKKIEFISEKSS